MLIGLLMKELNANVNALSTSSTLKWTTCASRAISALPELLVLTKNYTRPKRRQIDLRSKFSLSFCPCISIFCNYSIILPHFLDTKYKVEKLRAEAWACPCGLEWPSCTVGLGPTSRYGQIIHGGIICARACRSIYREVTKV